MATTALPPGPKGHPLLGNLRDLKLDRVLNFVAGCAREYGDFVPLRFLHKRIVFLSHPDYIEYVLLTNARNFIKSLGMRAISSLIGNGLVLSEGDFWLRQRRLMQPAFHRERVAAYGEIMATYAGRMAASWRDGEVRDVYTDMTRLTMEIAAKTLFDADVREEARGVGTTISVASEALSARLSSLWLLLPDSIPTPTNLRMRRAVRQLDEVVYRIIDDRRTHRDDRRDLLSMLLEAQDEDGARMTDRQVRDEVMTLFLAGHATTALALTWACYLLSEHPEAEAKLAAELEAVLGRRPPAAADLPELRYTEMVISEALRLYPPAPFVGREPLADCEIGGYRVSRGTSLIMSQWVTQRDPRFFPDPESFNPDRWADGLLQRLPRFAYFPFGGGPRICIGNTFAMMEAVLVLAAIAQRFRLRVVPGHPVTPEPAPTLRPKYGLKVVLEARARREESVAHSPRSRGLGA